jgi:hemolysin activation/secretion protein
MSRFLHQFFKIVVVSTCLSLMAPGEQYREPQWEGGGGLAPEIQGSDELSDPSISEKLQAAIRKEALEHLKREAEAYSVELAPQAVSPTQEVASDLQAQASTSDSAEVEVTLHRIEFSGVKAIDVDELNELVSVYLNKKIPFDKLLEMTAHVEALYRRNNFIARAILPPQNLDAGILHVDVLESKLSAIKVEEALVDMEKTQKRVLDIIYAQQGKGQPLNTASIERGLALANDLPGVSVTAGLKEGDEEAETELILKLYANRSRQQELIADNYGSNATGSWRITAMQTWINPRQWGDKLSALAVVTEGSQYVRLAYEWAIGTQGWRWGVNFSHMAYNVINGAVGVVGAYGQADTAGLNASYPLVRTPEHDSTFVMNFDQKQYNNVSAQDVSISTYQVQTGSMGVNGTIKELQPGGRVFTYDAQLTQGYVNLAGSMNQTSDASGPQTAGSYAKIRVSGTVIQPLTVDTSLFGSFKIQRADKNLDSSERMPLGGADGVRAYPTGEGSGSEGELASVELKHSLDEQTEVAAFYDVGRTNQQHNPNYPGGPTPNSYVLQGVGTSYSRNFNNGSMVKFTWARRLGSNPNPTQTGTDQDGTLERNRYWLQVLMPF